jgi:hypothetical protein
MARRVFHSFHYDRDAWRVQQVKQMGVVEGQPLLSSNKWEEVKKGGPAAIRKWIDGQMIGKSCVVVLIGSKTAGREWVEYEFKTGWKNGKGVLGVYIHNLEDRTRKTDTKGKNPFEGFTLGSGAAKRDFAKLVKTYDPPSGSAYSYIKKNIADWVEEAVAIREKH